jgi:hypothetical protein
LSGGERDGGGSVAARATGGDDRAVDGAPPAAERCFGVKCTALGVVAAFSSSLVAAVGRISIRGERAKVPPLHE